MVPPQTAYQVENFDPFPNEDLICSICDCVFYDPVECPCRHVYCRNCICDWLSCQNTCPVCRKSVILYELRAVGPIIKNMIMKLTIRCPNSEHGCKKNFALEEYDSHLVNCDYVVVECSKCQEKMVVKDKFKHEQLECNYRLIQCKKYCSLMLPAIVIESHDCAGELTKEIGDKKKLINELKNNLKYCKKQFNKDATASQAIDVIRAGKSFAATFINKIKKFLVDFSRRVDRKQRTKETINRPENVDNSWEGNGIESDLINANRLHCAPVFHCFHDEIFNPSDSSEAEVRSVTTTLDEPSEFIIPTGRNIGTECSYGDNENSVASTPNVSIKVDEMRKRKKFHSGVNISHEMQRPIVMFTIPNVRMSKQRKFSNSTNTIGKLETRQLPYLNTGNVNRIKLNLKTPEIIQNPGMSSKGRFKINCISENECDRNILLLANKGGSIVFR
ncbi:E3 ubiquitin-protein ligase PDZRN3-like [Centruroides vittatus]|uniref:E3 ubiquitin-protein ligase PDZRN3-like n=1 Tax=Centruroides vittatus TaxID=120091 RepID=UPI0035105418